ERTFWSVRVPVIHRKAAASYFHAQTSTLLQQRSHRAHIDGDRSSGWEAAAADAMSQRQRETVGTNGEQTYNPIGPLPFRTSDQFRLHRSGDAQRASQRLLLDRHHTGMTTDGREIDGAPQRLPRDIFPPVGDGWHRLRRIRKKLARAQLDAPGASGRRPLI